MGNSVVSRGRSAEGGILHVTECRTQCTVGVEVVGDWAYRDVEKAVSFVVSRRGSAEGSVVLVAECRTQGAIDVEVVGG